jgi:hypothetical protein
VCPRLIRLQGTLHSLEKYGSPTRSRPALLTKAIPRWCFLLQGVALTVGAVWEEGNIGVDPESSPIPRGNEIAADVPVLVWPTGVLKTFDQSCTL